MIYKRKIYDELVELKKELNGSKAILIEGARRIGKSTIAQEFAKNEYESYILIDFSIVKEEIKEYFKKYITDLDRLFLYLQTEYNIKLKNRKSLIIFDEVQFFPFARSAIKHLVKDGRYDYLETGSLISIKENTKDILIPSEERRIKMNPMDFEEFLWAFNESILVDYIKDCFIKLNPLEQSLHNKAKYLFSEYLIVGGMPQSVHAYLINNKSFLKSDNEKKDILKLYLDDIGKISSRYKNKVKDIFDSIPGLLSRHEKRVRFNDIKNNSRFDNYEDSFFWLADSYMTNNCFSCSDPNYALKLNEVRTSLKCYMSDTGLLLSSVLTNKEVDKNRLYLELLNGNLNINKGMFYENIVAQMLVANGYNLYFYTHYNKEKRRNDMEIDFLIQNRKTLEFKLIPIEVKSGENYRYNSLIRFNEKYKERIYRSYIIHPKNLIVKDDGVICIPIYMTFCL